MRRAWIAGLAVALPLLAALPLHAAPPGSTDEADANAEQEFREGVEKLLRAFDLLLGRLPQYAPPEVLENGDIIIRRKPPRPPEKKAKPPFGRGEWT